MSGSEKDQLVSIIIPTFKRLNKLEACLNSILGSTYTNFEIIVVNDNPKEDLTKPLMNYPIQLIQNNDRTFPANSRNIGATFAHGDLLFFVDDDNIMRNDTIYRLVKAYLSLNNIGLLGPKMLDGNDSVWFMGTKVNWKSLILKPVDKNRTKDEVIDTDVIPNAYMISKLLYLMIGMEDETLKIFNEDLDLATRLKIRGFKNYIYTGSIIIHDYGTLNQHLSAERIHINFRNFLIVWRRYADKPRFLMFSMRYFLYAFYYFAYKIPVELRGNGILTNYRYFLTGIGSGLFSSSRFRR